MSLHIHVVTERTNEHRLVVVCDRNALRIKQGEQVVHVHLDEVHQLIDALNVGESMCVEDMRRGPYINPLLHLEPQDTKENG